MRIPDSFISALESVGTRVSNIIEFWMVLFKNLGYAPKLLVSVLKKAEESYSIL